MSLLRTILTPLPLWLAITVSAGITQFDYSPALNTKTSDWGTGAKEVYDVAMKVSNPSLAGKTIHGVRIPLVAKHVQSCKVWVSSQLALIKDEQTGKKVNSPDVLSLEAIVDNGLIEVTFSQPITIPVEGLWVGYSFEITDKTTSSDSHPVIVYPNDTQLPGLMVHTSSRYMKWTDINAITGCCSAMEVLIDGVDDNAAGLQNIEKCYARSDSAARLPIFISNHGSKEISSVEYTYDVASLSGTNTIQFPTPIASRFNLPVPVTISLPLVSQTGDYNGTINITKVNGQPNADNAQSKPFTLAIIGFIPTTHPLMEEYTGLWCGFCPRGFACLEHMDHLYGDDFIGISFHSGDPMEIPGGIPDDVHSFPEAHLNRTLVNDPDFNEINPIWKQLSREFSIASITPRAWWTGDDHTEIYAEATTRFVSGEDDADYKVAYVLVQNGMSDPNWKQTNNFAGDESYKNDPYMAPFTKGQHQVSGLVFNDIAIFSPALNGTPGSVGKRFSAGQEMKHSITIKSADIRNIYDDELLQNPNQLCLVTILLDRKGTVVNTARCPVDMEPVSVVSLMADGGHPVYYDLLGRRVDTPSHGIYIRVLDGQATKVRY